MSNQKTTPGPWVRSPDIHGRFTIYASEAPLAALADVFVTPTGDHGANGLLMATAPELLAELEQCRIVLLAAYAEVIDQDGKVAILQRIEKTEAVIRKAKGEA